MLCHMAGMVVEEGKEKRGAVKQKATPNTYKASGCQG